MRTWVLVILILLPVVGFTGDNLVVEREEAARCGPERIRLTPTRGRASPTSLYIPKNLDDALSELDRLLPPCFIQQLRAMPERDLLQYHLTLGMWMRNHWGLWHKSRLAQHFNGIGIHHPDDMSSIILTSFWRRLREKPVDLDRQVGIYQLYWRIVGGKSGGGRTPDSR